MILRVTAFAVAVLAVASTCCAQHPADTLATDSVSVYESAERILDDRLSASSARTQTQTSEVLAQLALNPLRVNRASAPELSTIPGLSPSLARQIVRRRNREGRYPSVEALTQIEGMGPDRLRTIRPYLTVSSNPSDDDSEGPFSSVQAATSAFDLQVIQRVTRGLDERAGYSSDSTRTGFLGSPGHFSTRLRVGLDRRAQLALTLDKDAGEPFGWSPRKRTFGFDHVAGNLTFRDLGPVETLVLGDYAVQYGQGVALWQGMSFGKGRDPVSPLVRSGRGIVPFQSTTENRYFRGGAAAISVSPSVTTSFFVSRRRRDATLDSTAAHGAGKPIPAQTLSAGGYHRTPSEQQRKATFGKTTIGGALDAHAASFRVGLTGYRSWFDRPLRPPSRGSRRVDVSGDHTMMLSAFADGDVGPYTVFGEVARTGDQVYGGVVGAALNHEAGVELLAFARSFPPAFAGLYNGAIGESGSTQNEEGLYLGGRLQISERWRLSAYVDQYRFPWLRYATPRPSRGLDTRLVAHYSPRPWLTTYLQIRAEREDAGTETMGPHGRRLAALQPEFRTSARWHVEYAFSDRLSLRTRLQLSRYRTRQAPISHGLVVSQGLRLDPTDNLQIDGRIAFFDTDGYESRIYSYEHDLLYSFSVPVLYDRGRRSYVLLTYAPFSTVTIEAKYGVTWYPHRRTIGSGLNTIRDNRSRELRLQVRWTH